MLYTDRHEVRRSPDEPVALPPVPRPVRVSRRDCAQPAVPVCTAIGRALARFQLHPLDDALRIGHGVERLLHYLNTALYWRRCGRQRIRRPGYTPSGLLAAVQSLSPCLMGFLGFVLLAVPIYGQIYPSRCPFWRHSDPTRATGASRGTL